MHTWIDCPPVADLGYFTGSVTDTNGEHRETKLDGKLRHRLMENASNDLIIYHKNLDTLRSEQEQF